MGTKLTPVIAGFIPLLDSAVLVAAKEKGFAEREGIALQLIRETSWANIRDRLAVGHFDVAHMLAPMPIAASLNLTSLAVPMLAPMVLGLGGNAITVAIPFGGKWPILAPIRMAIPLLRVSAFAKGALCPQRERRESAEVRRCSSFFRSRLRAPLLARSSRT
jgi:hypothetical protein